MPEINLEINHDLTTAESASRLKGRLFEESAHRDKFRLISQDWDDDSVSFVLKSLKIFDVTGTILFEAGKLKIRVVTPYIPPVFRNGLEGNIRSDVTRLLGN